MRTIYKHGKSIKILVVTFPKIRMEMFLALAQGNVGYSELSKQYGITKHRARTTAGQFIYWLRRIAEDLNDEEIETIMLRRETYESQLSVRQFLEKYGQFLIRKIERYQILGRIKISDNLKCTHSEWKTIWYQKQKN